MDQLFWVWKPDSGEEKDDGQWVYGPDMCSALVKHAEKYDDERDLVNNPETWKVIDGDREVSVRVVARESIDYHVEEET